MGGDDYHTLRLDRAERKGENVGDVGRVGHAGASHRGGRRREGEASSERLRVALELLRRPVEGRADAALRVRLRRKRMARAEAHQLLDIGAKLLPRDVVGNLLGVAAVAATGSIAAARDRKSTRLNSSN